MSGRGIDSADDLVSLLERTDPCVVRYSVLMLNAGTRPVYGFRVGHFVVRQSTEGEVGLSGEGGETLRGGVVLDYLAPGAEVADGASMRFTGAHAWDVAWFFADELSRHLVVDARGFEASARSWPGIDHLWSQGPAIANGLVPVPWHHTETYARLRAAERGEAA
ncbi:MAG TPA: hypothetical protein VK509_22750 [Polyangiales bacterium]|nr:hypothetical protein [Polyangiales bacterium]